MFIRRACWTGDLQRRFPSFVTSLALSGIIPRKPSNWDELRQADMAMQSGILEDANAIHYFDSIHRSDWKDFLRKSIEQDWYPFNETGEFRRAPVPDTVHRRRIKRT